MPCGSIFSHRVAVYWLGRAVERWRDVRYLLFEARPDFVSWFAWLYELHGEAFADDIQGDEDRIAELRPAFEVLADAGALIRAAA